MGKYKNKLGFEGIPRINEIVPKDIGFWFGLFYDADDEVRYFADTLREWKRQRKCLADYVQDEEHRQALLRDLYRLQDWMSIQLRSAQALQGQPMAEQSRYYLERRDVFLRETFPYEEGRLLSWEPPIERDEPFNFEQLKGFCVLTYQSGAVTKIRLQLQEAGLFSVGWKEAGSISEEVESIENEMRIDGSAAVIIKLQKPKKSGTIYILNHTRKAVERVPVS